ncbi:50S ribosomal protein L35 [Candidatus Roizmanbacteria bacterium]|nr:50S ribosomal protein L35 [Candidatus Roizmanbacteria bacterium]
MKQKTHKSAARRFKLSAKGKVLHRSNGLRHLRNNKQNKQIRGLKQMKEVTGIMGTKIKKLLGKA